MPKRTTGEIYLDTVQALTEQRWGAARAGLDDLAQSDNTVKIPKNAEDYGMPKDNPYYDLIQDRILEANAIAERHRRGY